MIKRIIWTTILIASACVHLPAQEPRAVPPLDQVAKISIGSDGGWTLELRADGSGRLTYGSSACNEARIPRGTFSLANAYNLLVPHLVPKTSDSNAMFVFLDPKMPKPGSSVYALYLEDRKIVRPLMTQALEKGEQLNPDRFKELLKERSPIPEDRP